MDVLRRSLNRCAQNEARVKASSSSVAKYWYRLHWCYFSYFLELCQLIGLHMSSVKGICFSFFKEILSNVSKYAFVIPYHPGLYLLSRAVHILVSAFSLSVWRIYCEKNWLNAWLNTNGARRNNLYSILVYWKKKCFSFSYIYIVDFKL